MVSKSFITLQPFSQLNNPTTLLIMSDVKVEENKPKLEDVTMEDASTSNVKTEDNKPSAAVSSTQVPATEEFAPQKGEDGELIIKDLPESLKGKSEEEVAEVKKAIVEQGESPQLAPSLAILRYGPLNP